MLKSTILSFLIQSLCLNIERNREYLYNFYPDQANACYKGAVSKVIEYNLDAPMFLFEKNIENVAYAYIQNVMPPEVYSPIIIGGQVILQKRFAIALYKNNVYLWTNFDTFGINVNIQWK